MSILARAHRNSAEFAHPGSYDPPTQDSVALAFAGQYEGLVRYCYGNGRWFFWTGTHWKKDDREQTFQLIRDVTRDLSAQSRDGSRSGMRRAQYLAGVEKLARGDERLVASMSDWDADPMLLGTPGGTVDLRTGEIRPPAPNDLITRVTSVAPKRGTDCPRWLNFLAQSTCGDKETITFLRQWSGYVLTGVTTEHALLFIYGAGGNGKSVFLNVLMGILGEYATTAAMDTFTASQGDKHPTDLAMLRGARLVTASETDEGRAWAESRIKQLTGGDPITARFMRHDFFTFRPTFKLMIIGNHQPVLKNVDEGAKRRFRIVPFNNKPENPDLNLEQALKSEWPAILQWMIDGCRDWSQNGLILPETIAGATAEYFRDVDIVGRWLEDMCEVEPGNGHRWESSAALFASWSQYARMNGEEPGSMRALGVKLQRKGLAQHRTGSARGFRGIRLKVTFRPSCDRNDDI